MRKRARRPWVCGRRRPAGRRPFVRTGLLRQLLHTLAHRSDVLAVVAVAQQPGALSGRHVLRTPFGQTEHEVLAGLSLAAIEQWQFQPPVSRNKPVLVRVQQRFEFVPDHKG